MIDETLEKIKVMQGRDPAQPAQTDDQQQPRGSQWTSSIPQVASEDVIDIGNGRYAHFRRDRRFAQVQVVFTAPKGVDPNPGRELTDQFKELGWTWQRKEPGKPWIYQLENSSPDDPTARGDSRDALHEQFLLVIQEYREKHGLPPTLGWESMTASDTKPRNDERRCLASSAVVDELVSKSEKQKLPSEKREARAGGPEGMLDAFASVGARRFDLTFTDATGEKIGFRGNRPLEQLRPAMSAILQEAAERQHNVIVRPRSPGVTLIQLDDLGEDTAARLLPVSFLIQRTSPGNYQAWAAVADGDADFARRLRKGAGADLTASGATRISGSFNFKAKYATAGFPRVETVHTGPGLIVTRSDLEALGVVALPEMSPSSRRVSHRQSGRKAWPNYERCVQNAPSARDSDRPDISRADFTFCLLAIDWGWSFEDTAARLMEVSTKAMENGEAYALRTAQNAAAAIERRGARKR